MACLMAAMYFLARHDPADREETGLHDGVDAPAHPGLPGHPVAVDADEDAQALGDDLFLGGADGPTRPRDHGDCSAGTLPRLGGPQDVEPLEERELVAGHEGGPLDEIGGADGPQPAEMRYP